MAILKIARMGHPVLAKPATAVADPASPGIRQLVTDMVHTMADADGMGLAAPQVHVPLRVVIFQIPGDVAGQGKIEDESGLVLTVLINPEIEPLTEAKDFGWEGCLSVPGLRGLVPRFSHIRYRGLTTAGGVIEREATGMHARVVQHECDHLDGILYPQRMTDLKSLVFATELKHLMSAEEAEDLAAEE
jgi:peptide deformylase